MGLCSTCTIGTNRRNTTRIDPRTHFVHYFLNDLFFLMNSTQIWNYADGTMLYTCDKKIQSVLENLEMNASTITTWFSENQMKLTENKSPPR